VNAQLGSFARHGGVAEWSNAPVLKTGEPARAPRVRIPPPPLFSREFLQILRFARSTARQPSLHGRVNAGHNRARLSPRLSPELSTEAPAADASRTYLRSGRACLTVRPQPFRSPPKLRARVKPGVGRTLRHSPPVSPGSTGSGGSGDTHQPRHHRRRPGHWQDAITPTLRRTATQIQDIADRVYPASLAGERYPNGVPVRPEQELT
jgi:hypothetical protein